MNYFIQGDPSKAEEIKAAFKKLGYNSREFDFSCGLFYTAERDVHYCISDCIANIIKTHPDYKELELPVEPKFKVGDWIANDYCAGKVIALTDDAYLLDSGQGIPFSCEHNAHLWTIEDAKDGDVLVDVYGNISIYEKCDDFDWMSYCSLGHNGGFQHFKIEHENEKTYPATKEQRDLLFAKMQEAGYQWDGEKKELKKIKPHYDIANFHAGMPVFVRDSDEHKWLYALFGIYNKDNSLYPFVVVNMRGYEQCIPFNEETKHLLGATDMCDERFINW